MTHPQDLIHFQQAAHELVSYAHSRGIVITVEPAPRTPLAMGNYDLVTSVRTTRNPPEFCGNCDEPLPGGCGGTFASEQQCAHHVFDLDKMCSDAMVRLLRQIDVDCENHTSAVFKGFTRAHRQMVERHYEWRMQVRGWEPMTPAKVAERFTMKFKTGGYVSKSTADTLTKPYEKSWGRLK